MSFRVRQSANSHSGELDPSAPNSIMITIGGSNIRMTTSTESRTIYSMS